MRWSSPILPVIMCGSRNATKNIKKTSHFEPSSPDYCGAAEKIPKLRGISTLVSADWVTQWNGGLLTWTSFSHIQVWENRSRAMVNANAVRQPEI